jgi:hypothetical protein
MTVMRLNQHRLALVTKTLAIPYASHNAAKASCWQPAGCSHIPHAAQHEPQPTAPPQERSHNRSSQIGMALSTLV